MKEGFIQVGGRFERESDGRGGIPAIENIVHFPDYQSSSPRFCWGEWDGSEFADSLESAYYNAVHWHPNLFSVPSEKIGMDFIREQARLFLAFAEQFAIEQIYLKSVLLMPLLLLQRRHSTSKRKDHIKCLEKRLHMWSLGQIPVLFNEGKTIQACLHKRILIQSIASNDSQKPFPRPCKLEMWNVKTALRMVSKEKSAGVLSLNDIIDGTTVADILVKKHPPPQSASPDALLPSSSPSIQIHPIFFEQISGELIRSTALCIRGSAGLSGIDAFGCCCMCTSFHGASTDLCNALAATADDCAPRSSIRLVLLPL